MVIRKLNELSVSALLREYSDILMELRQRGVIRTSNTVTSDYGEYIAAKKMKLQLVENSTKGYDAIDRMGVRYQIKSRRPTEFNKSLQLSVIRNIDSRPFEFLIAVVFNEDFSRRRIWKIPLNVVKRHSRFSKHQNGNIFILDKKVLEEKSVLKVI